MARFSVACACLAILLGSSSAAAKEVAIKSPNGKRIYKEGETFEEVTPLKRRRVVAEAVVGAAPEGHLGLLIGVLNMPIRRLDLYVGGGIEANPSRQFTASARYGFSIYGFHPYVAAGYVFRDLHGIGAFSHNAFAELGYTWSIHQTLRVSVGAGVRRLLHFGLHDGSPILAGYTDEALLQQQRDSLSRYSPILAIRISRAF
jgi:hypothetical protein